MTLTALTLIAVTLALPGPTNALLAIAGTTAGLRRGVILISAPLAGYAIAVLVLATLVTPAIDAVPQLAVAVRLIAAVVLVHAAIRLWRLADAEPQSSGGSTDTVRWAHVFLTTLLNPKALVLYVAATPEGHMALTPALALLPALIVLSSLLWLSIGRGLPALNPSLANRGVIERGGAIVLGLFAALISTSALAAMIG